MAISDWTGMGSPEGIITKVSENSGGLFGMTVWGLLWFALFSAFTGAAYKAGSTRPAIDGLLGSSFVMALASYYMGVLEWVSIYFTVVPSVMFVIGLILMVIKD